MNWNEYKDFVKETDPLGKEMLEEAEAEASIISVVIGLSVSIFFIYLFVKRRPQVANSDNDGLPIPEIEIADK